MQIGRKKQKPTVGQLNSQTNYIKPDFKMER